ncbi:MAG: DUF3592 domain-containing protein [Ramlibacter sp.]
MAAKLLSLLFTGLFAVGFGAGGIFGGVLPLLEITGNAWSVRSWQAVPGQVLEVEIETGQRRLVTTEVRYRYTFGGMEYESSRIGIGKAGGDSVGSWQRRWYNRLSDARANGRPVTVWVDPKRPHRAVLDREIRWGMVIFHIPFALLFTAIGGAAFYAFLYLLVTPMRVLEARKAPEVREVEDGRVHGAGLWLIAVFWCGLAWPVTALVWMEPQPWLPRIIVSCFAVVGGWLLWHAFRGGSLRTTDG